MRLNGNLEKESKLSVVVVDGDGQRDDALTLAVCVHSLNAGNRMPIEYEHRSLVHNLCIYITCMLTMIWPAINPGERDYFV